MTQEKLDIRLIAVDLDDTLLDDKRRITPAVASAVARASAAGVSVVLASGRMRPAMMGIYNALDLHSPMICYNGAFVADPDGEALFRCPIEAEQAREVVRFARERGIYAQYHIGSTYYFERDCEENRIYTANLGIAGQRVDDLTALEGGADKVLLVRMPDIAEETAVFAARFPGLSAARSKPFYLEMNHPAANKGAALEALASRMGLERSQVMAIGDGANDLPMLRWAGASVAMGNAPDAVKAECRFVAESNTRDGVADAICRWVLPGREAL